MAEPEKTQTQPRRETRYRVLNPGAAPACLEAGFILCRGCPGWTDMKKALETPESPWSRWPICCSATGLTIARKD